jgi:hypothetical protein
VIAGRTPAPFDCGFGAVLGEAELEGERRNALPNEAILVGARESVAVWKGSGTSGRPIELPTAAASAPRLLSSAPKAMTLRSGKIGKAMSRLRFATSDFDGTLGRSTK